MHGVSMAYSFDDPGAADRHQTQYFETPWVVTGHGVAFDDDVRELYDKLHELQRLFLIEAARYNVLPLDDGLSKPTTRRSPAGRCSSPAPASCSFPTAGPAACCPPRVG